MTAQHPDPGKRLLDLLVVGQAAQAESEARALLERDPAFGFAWKVLGIALAQQGKNALESLRQAAQALPDDAEAHSNLATALREAGHLDQAVESFRRAIALQPDFAGAHHNLGLALRDLDRLDEAAASFRAALALQPHLAPAHLNLATLLHQQGSLADAMHHCRSALEIDPNLPEGLATMAELLSYDGEFSQAEALYRHALSVQPDFAPALVGIARLRKMAQNDDTWLASVQRLLGGNPPPVQEAALRYALGKYFDDLRDFPQAFANYRRANELDKLLAGPGYSYGGESQKRIDDARLRVFDGAWVGRHRCAENQSALPILIVGMPRSGTSLTEQILAAHPDVFGAGELPFWNSTARLNEAALLNGDGAPLQAIGAQYLRLVQSYSSQATRVVDKMPANFLYLGMIHAALPHARILHMRRNPVDTCLSIYFQQFDKSQTYANDLQHLADFYREYLRLMAHWRKTLPPDAILDLPYEALVGDQEGWTRKVLDFVGLPWDARCLDFQQRARTVSTASSWQVRQKIGTASVERWRHYEAYAQPLLGLLD